MPSKYHKVYHKVESYNKITYCHTLNKIKFY